MNKDSILNGHIVSGTIPYLIDTKYGCVVYVRSFILL